MKIKIEEKINTFILNIAELYEPHLATSIDDSEFEKMVEEILRKKDLFVEELLALMDEKISPPEVILTTEDQPKLQEPEGVKDLWQGGVDLPRDTSSLAPVNENFSGQDFSKMAVSAAQAVSTPGTSSIGFVDEEVGIPAHNLGMSVAEENRIASGLPAKRTAPHILVDHTGVKETVPQVKIARPVPGASKKETVETLSTKENIEEETKSILRRLQDICIPHQTSPYKPLSIISCDILSLAATYLPTDHSNEAPRYESVKALWAALQNIIGVLKQFQNNLGRYRELGALQKDLNELISQLMVETAQYSLPDEIPVEEETVNPTQEEEGKKDG